MGTGSSDGDGRGPVPNELFDNQLGRQDADGHVAVGQLRRPVPPCERAFRRRAERRRRSARRRNCRTWGTSPFPTGEEIGDVSTQWAPSAVRPSRYVTARGSFSVSRTGLSSSTGAECEANSATRWSPGSGLRRCGPSSSDRLATRVDSRAVRRSESKCRRGRAPGNRHSLATGRRLTASLAQRLPSASFAPMRMRKERMVQVVGAAVEERLAVLPRLHLGPQWVELVKQQGRHAESRGPKPGGPWLP